MVICDQEHFLNIWNQMKQYETQLQHLVAPARKFIEATLRRPNEQTWTGISVQQIGGQYLVMFEGEYYDSGSGAADGNSYAIPLAYVLEGEEGVKKFFEEEKAKAAEENRQRSERRAEHDRDERYRRYLNLKNEFEPERAKEVVKSTEVNFIPPPPEPPAPRPLNRVG